MAPPSLASTVYQEWLLQCVDACLIYVSASLQPFLPPGHTPAHNKDKLIEQHDQVITMTSVYLAAVSMCVLICSASSLVGVSMSAVSGRLVCGACDGGRSIW